MHMHARVCMWLCAHVCLCQRVERRGVSGEGRQWSPLYPCHRRLPSPGPAPPWVPGVERGVRNSQGRDQAAGKGQEHLSVPGGSALVTQSESVSGPQPYCWPGGGGSGVRGRGRLSRKARFHLLLRGCRLRWQEPERRREAGKSPGRTGPQGFGEEVAGLGGDYSAHKGCSPALPSDLSLSLVTEAGLVAGRGRGAGASPFAAVSLPFPPGPTARPCPSHAMLPVLTGWTPHLSVNKRQEDNDRVLPLQPPPPYWGASFSAEWLGGGQTWHPVSSVARSALRLCLGTAVNG